MSSLSSERGRSVSALVLVLLGIVALSGCDEATGPEEPALSVTVNTTGADPDADGYYVSIPGANKPVGASGAALFERLEPGEYDVELGGVAFNCNVTSPNPQHVTVTSSSQNVVFDVACEHTALIAFVSDATGSNQIYVKRPDGTGRRQITNTLGDNTDPVWSPDGSRLAFTSTRDGTPELYVMSFDGGSVRRLTNDPGTEGIPVWSPDGSKLAFTRAASANAKPAIFVVNADGTNTVNVSMDTTRFNLSPDWSPDGTRLVYAAQQFSCCQNGESELRIVNADGTGRKTIVSTIFTTPNYKTNPRWSPNGTRIAFINVVTVALINVDGTQETNLPGTAYGLLDDWSPDGKELLLNLGSDIQVFDIAANSLRNVTNNGTSSFEFSESWSPDGSKILFNRSGEIFSINSDGTGAADLTPDFATEWAPRWRP
jgi:Tol biopolymer transport system component